MTTVCEVCKEEPYYKTVTANIPFEPCIVNLQVCKGCAKSIEELEKRENERRSNPEQSGVNESL